jgi:hypothetical protein
MMNNLKQNTLFMSTSKLLTVMYVNGWPFKKNQVLYLGSGTTPFSIIADTSGRFMVKVPDESFIRTIITQPTSIPDNVPVDFTCEITSDKSAIISLDGHELLLDNEAEGRIYHLPVKANFDVSVNLNYPMLLSVNNRPIEQELFLKLGDITGRMRSRNYHKIIGSAPILLDLLLGDSCLINRVNQYYNYPLSYMPHDVRLEPSWLEENTEFSITGIDHKLLTGVNPPISQAEFLACPVAYLKGEPVSVQDCLWAVCESTTHSIPGISTIPTSGQIAYSTFYKDNNVILTASTPTASILGSIADVLIVAMKPLVDVIHKHYGITVTPAV